MVVSFFTRLSGHLESAFALSAAGRTAAARIQRRVGQVCDPVGVEGFLRILVQQPHRVEQPRAAAALRPCICISGWLA